MTSVEDGTQKVESDWDEKKERVLLPQPGTKEDRDQVVPSRHITTSSPTVFDAIKLEEEQVEGKMTETDKNMTAGEGNKGVIGEDEMDSAEAILDSVDSGDRQPSSNAPVVNHLTGKVQRALHTITLISLVSICTAYGSLNLLLLLLEGDKGKKLILI